MSSRGFFVDLAGVTDVEGVAGVDAMDGVDAADDALLAVGIGKKNVLGLSKSLTGWAQPVYRLVLSMLSARIIMINNTFLEMCLQI
jgi:hypothetical protein